MKKTTQVDRKFRLVNFKAHPKLIARMNREARIAGTDGSKFIRAAIVEKCDRAERERLGSSFPVLAQATNGNGGRP